VRLALNPDLAITVSRRGRYENQPVEALSASERLRLDLVLRDLVSSMAGIPILVLDEAEALDVENLRLVLRYLERRTDYAVIMVIATSSEPIEGAKGWGQVFLDEGKPLPVAA
jgi:ABC-type multidrug transport system ATPase subunit